MVICKWSPSPCVVSTLATIQIKSRISQCGENYRVSAINLRNLKIFLEMISHKSPVYLLQFEVP